jgi:hypothetical protein
MHGILYLLITTYASNVPKRQHSAVYRDAVQEKYLAAFELTFLRMKP